MLFQKQLHSPNGRIEPYDPAKPWYAGELRLEWVTPGSKPRVYVYTCSQEEWKTAREAMKHLLQLGRLSPESYMEGDHGEHQRGLSALDLDGKPHGPALVEQFCDAAIRTQNEEDGVQDATLYLSAFVLLMKERREKRAAALAEEEE